MNGDLMASGYLIEPCSDTVRLQRHLDVGSASNQRVRARQTVAGALQN
jgi:hypothetical protein